MFLVYILYSEEHDKFYVGQTNDINDRISRHNKGRVKSTAPYAPWIIKLQISKKSRSEAVKLEAKLKNLSKLRLNKFIMKYS